MYYTYIYYTNHSYNIQTNAIIYLHKNKRAWDNIADLGEVSLVERSQKSVRANRSSIILL